MYATYDNFNKYINQGKSEKRAKKVHFVSNIIKIETAEIVEKFIYLKN